jgi:tetratricopeptide (TPR) repeat protein
VLDGQARFLSIAARNTAALFAAERLIALAGSTNDDLMLARGYLRRAEIAIIRHHFAAAWADLDLVEALTESQPTYSMRLSLADALLQKAHIIDIQQTTPDIRYAQQACDIYHELDNLRDESIALFRMGNYYRRIGDYAQALFQRREALALALKVGDREVEVRVRNDLGEDLMHLGCYSEARTMLESAISIGRSINYLRAAAGALEGLARALHHLGDQAAALACIEEALALDTTHDLQQMRGYFLATQGYILEATERNAEAALAYQASLEYWKIHGSTEAALESRSGLLRLALARRDLGMAAQLVPTILPFLSSRGLSDALEPMNVYLSCWQALATTNHPSANTFLTMSHKLLQRQAAQISDPTLRSSFLLNIGAHSQITRSYQRSLMEVQNPYAFAMLADEPEQYRRIAS